MNIVQPVVSTVKTAVRSQTTQNIVRFTAPVAGAAVRGLQKGAIFGAGIAAFGYGWKMAERGVPKVLDPVVKVLHLASKGEPVINVNVSVPEKAQTETSVENDSDEKSE